MSHQKTFPWIIGFIGLVMAAMLAMPLVGCAGQNNTNEDRTAASSSAEQTDTSAAEDLEALIDVSVVIESTAENDQISENATLEVAEHATALEALQAANSDVVIDDGFVKSIDGLENGAYGSMSGWTYSVNGEQPTVGADAYELANGDTVTWTYVQ